MEKVCFKCGKEKDVSAPYARWFPCCQIFLCQNCGGRDSCPKCGKYL